MTYEQGKRSLLTSHDTSLCLSKVFNKVVSNNVQFTRWHACQPKQQCNPLKRLQGI